MSNVCLPVPYPYEHYTQDCKMGFFVIIFIFRHISTKVGVKANIVLFNSCVKIPFKDLHTLLKYEQKLKGLFFSDSS